jgi:MoaA/NifB/PqqE/SkfB family radical SAM enzyme
MSIQKSSTIVFKPSNSLRSTRAYIDTGKFCNYDCEFCYYKDQLDIRDDLEVIKSRITRAAEYGMNSIEFCGGESTVEPNWFKFLDHARECGFKSISVVTNGSMLAKPVFLKKSIENGLTEALFSLHGSNKEMHDKIVGRTGAFTRIMQAIKNCNDAGLPVRLNCTVYDINHEKLGNDYCDLIKELNPLEVNFIAVKYNLDNVDFRPVEYKDIINSVKLAIDILKDHIKYINVRMVPFCLMQGYEYYNVNHYQQIYDVYDWNRATYEQNYEAKKLTEVEQTKKDFEAAARFRIAGYHKSESCKDCANFYICDGIDNKLKDQVLTPIPGKKIFDPMYYRKDFYADVNFNINS